MEEVLTTKELAMGQPEYVEVSCTQDGTRTGKLRHRSGHGQPECFGILQEERGFMTQSYKAIAVC